MTAPTSMSNGSHQMEEQERQLADFLRPLALDEATLHTLAYQFSNVFRELALISDDQFLPTPVTNLPTGSETGQCLAIDVGGSNLRVSFIELLGDAADLVSPENGRDRSREAIKKAQRPRFRSTLEKAWPIGEHLKMDKTEDLFAWIGDCIAEVVGDRLSADQGKVDPPEELDMGITFSFPMQQIDLTAATLMPMGKGFNMSSNLDLGPLLLSGYVRHTRRQSPSSASQPSKRRKFGPLPKLRIAAITNDTIATLASMAYQVKSLPNSRVVAGLIVGTGVNATIPMKFTDLGAQKSENIRSRYPEAAETIVNTEITISGAQGPLEPITTTWDRELDRALPRPGFQPLEYMTGGRYVGELVRIIFHSYMTTAHTPIIESAHLPAAIVHGYSLTTKFVSEYVGRARNNVELVEHLKRLYPPPESSNWAWTPHAAGALRKIAQSVQARSAGLIAAATVGLLATVGEITLADPAMPIEQSDPPDKPKVTSSKLPATPHHLDRSTRDGLSPAPGVSSWRTGPEELVIAYTGGIIQHYPNFKEQCQRFIDRLVMRAGPQDGGKSVLLREARNGGIIGAGVLAGMVTAPRKTV